MGEMTGMWKQIIYRRVERNVEADYMLGELTGIWKQIICYAN